MKTFLFNIPNEIKNWSNTLDIKTVLCSRSWLVFNDEGLRELYIFQKDGTVIASHNGNVTKAKWELLAVNNSLIIENPNGTSFLLNPSYYDQKVLLLQVDGTNSFALMIGEQYIQELALESVEKAKLYVENRDEFDNQKRKDKEAEQALEEARGKAWEKFIADKVEEQMKTPENLKKIKINKLKTRVLWAFVIISLVSVILLIFDINCHKASHVLVEFIVFITSLFFSILCLALIDNVREEIKYKITKEHPLDDFQIK